MRRPYHGATLGRLRPWIAASVAILLSLASSSVWAIPAGQDPSDPVLDRRLELTLAETVELALRHNLQVRIASRNPDVSEENIRLQRSFFDPVLGFNLPQNFTRSTQPTSSVFGGADVLSREFVTTGFTVRSQTTWGLAWGFDGTATRSVSNNEFETVNPRYDTTLGVNVRQPLLRGRGSSTTRLLRVAQNDFSVSREVLRQQLQQSLFQVIAAYWNLVNADRSLDVAQRSLQLAQEQLDRNNAMVRIGVLAAVDVIQTEQQVADAELTVIQSEILLRNQQDALKALLNLDAVVPEGWDVELVPLDEPRVDAEAIDVDAAVARALVRSPVLRQDRINLDSRKIDLAAANNQLLPQVDLVGNFQLNGLGGDRIFREGIFGGGVLEVQDGGLDQSLQQLLSGDFNNWTVGLQVSFAVRNDQARAQFATASIREQQAADQIRDRELQVRLAVRNAARAVEGGTQQVRAAQNALELAERQYAAELRRFETGTSSTFQVLAFQRQLTGARQRELNALIGLNLALANFEFARGTLLESYGVELEDAGTGGPMLEGRN